MKRWLYLALFLAASSAAGAQEVQLGCRRLRIALPQGIGPEVVEQDWGSGRPHGDATASLELVGCDGRLLDRFVLEAPLARLDPDPIRGAPHPTYLVSVDLTAEAGSYSGPLTLPVQILREHLAAVAATYPDGHTETVRLAVTGKSDWRKRRARFRDELLSVSCQPQNGVFVTSFRRLSPTRRGWQATVRTRDGLWESDGPFPSTSLFPSAFSVR